MNYAENLLWLAQDAGDSAYVTDPDFLATLPFWITAGEQRILRDLDLLSAYVNDDTGSLSANRRLFTLPTAQGTFTILGSIRVVLPGPPLAVNPALSPISREAMDEFYPGDGAVGNPSIPQYFCPFDEFSVLIGPAPDQNYATRVWGQVNPASLNDQASQGSASSGTYISNYLPDLFHAAEMVDVMAWQRQFGVTADQKDGAIDWESMYQSLMKSELVQEARRAFEGQGWAMRQPSPIATPPQT